MLPLSTTQVLDIVIACPGMPFNGHTKSALGGSETAAKEMAASLKKLGHNVVVFSNTEEPGSYDGIQYMNLEHWAAYSTTTPHDIHIAQRAPDMFGTHLNSRMNVLWNHDLAQGRRMNEFRRSLWNVDKVFTVSQWHKEQSDKTFQIEDENLIVASRNGINLNDVQEAIELTQESGFERDENKLMYCARPERGLDVLLEDIYPQLLEENPDFRLHIAGYSNGHESMSKFYSYIDQLIESFGDQIVWLGHLPKVELYKHYLTAGAYVYPTPSPTMPNFYEVSCITAMECLACGLPFVSMERGALSETLSPFAYYLVDDSAQGQTRIDNFVYNTMQASGESEENREFMQEHAFKNLSWDSLAVEWTAIFNNHISKMNDDPNRLARHFLRHNEIMPLYHLADNFDIDSAIMEYADDLYSQAIEGPNTYYNSMVKKWPDKIVTNAKNEQRYLQVSDFISRLDDDRRLVFEFGCSTGSYLINLANENPERHFVGYDFDKDAIAKAREFATKFATNGNVTFHDSMPFTAQADVLLINEVLEHTPKPWQVLDLAESAAKYGAVVYGTVPYGPWEYGHDYTGTNYAEHLWQFDMHDFRDMLKKKEGVIVNSMSQGPGMGKLAAALGWWVFAYEVNGEATKPIDMLRHCALQRPRQTVSLAMICGPESEEQLRWVLNGVIDIADEIYIGNCGGKMSIDAQLIVKDFANKHKEKTVSLVEAPDPLVDGFDRARNQVLSHCMSDWVLWLDDDERFVDPHQMQKYLRGNIWNGYSLRQHHFAIDTGFDPDKPVRFFRNHRGIRFYGAIHEHPELALNEGPGGTIVLSDVHIAHTGYLSESVRKGRFKRNTPLMELDCERYPERNLQKSLLMRDKMIMVRDMLKMTGEITPPIRNELEEVVKMYREHFLGKANFYGSDPSEYYAQALELLGKGFGPGDLKEAGILDSIAGRWENAEDLLEDLKFKLAAYEAPKKSEFY